MSTFSVRPYSKSELALLYFPYSDERMAVQHLRRWMNRSADIREMLRETGYRTHDRGFSAHQVEFIFSILGEP
jgi:hypothetical protein